MMSIEDKWGRLRLQAIDAAYQAHVEGLFKVLVASAADEEGAKERFKRGLELADVAFLLAIEGCEEQAKGGAS